MTWRRTGRNVRVRVRPPDVDRDLGENRHFALAPRGRRRSSIGPLVLDAYISSHHPEAKWSVMAVLFENISCLSESWRTRAMSSLCERLIMRQLPSTLEERARVRLSLLHLPVEVRFRSHYSRGRQ